MLMVRIGLTIGWHCDHCVQREVKQSCKALRVQEPPFVHNPAAVAAFHALDCDMLAQAYTPGATVAQVALAYGVSDAVVARKLRKFGLNRPRANERTKQLLALTHRELKQRFIASTIRDLAVEYNVQKSFVSRLLKVRGVTRRAGVGGRRYQAGSPQELAYLLRRSA